MITAALIFAGLSFVVLPLLFALVLCEAAKLGDRQAANVRRALPVEEIARKVGEAAKR